MARKRTAAAVLPPEGMLTRDFGPPIRLRHVRATPPPPAELQGAELARYQAAAIRPDPQRAVVKEFRDDPSQVGGGFTRGARVRDPLARMFEMNHLTKRQWDAVEAFRDDLALAAGARMETPEECGVRSAPTNRNWPSDTQLDAMRRTSLTMQALEEDERTLLIWTVIQHRTLKDYARYAGVRDETASDMLQDVLNVLELRHAPVERRR